MSIHRRAAKRDANEAEIVEALKKAGAQVLRISQPVDLVVAYNLRNYLLEVKSDNGRLTPMQQKWFAEWEGPAYVVHNPEEALLAIGAIKQPG